ncbi:MAG: GHKL domain-containing protein [Merdibacter sp.]
MFEISVLFFSNFLNGILFYYLLCRTSKMDKISFSKLATFVVLIFIKSSASVLKIPLINLLNSVLVYFYFIIHSPEKTLKNVGLAVFFLCGSMISEELALMIVKAVNENTLENFSPLVYFLAITLSKLILCIYVYILIMIVNFRYNGKIKLSNFLLMVTFPVSIIILMIVSRYSFVIDGINISMFFAYIIIIVAVFCSCYVFNKVMIDANNEKELTILKESKKKDCEYYTLLFKKNERERIIIHDIKKHTQCVMNMLNHADYEGAKRYLRQFTGNLTSINYIVTGNKILDLIISSWQETINNNHINLDVTNVEKINLSSISDMDTCTIFGNIFSNAIESCLNSKEKKIIIYYKKLDRNVLFKVINSCDRVNVENNNFFSNKEDKYNHGYGLKSIALCARQNNALYKASFNDINNEFETSILFQNILH